MDYTMCFRCVLLVVLCVAPVCADILYPSGSASTLIPNADITPTLFAMPGGGITMFGKTSNVFVCKLDKLGGIFTSTPTVDPIYTMSLWTGSELNFKDHPTGRISTTTAVTGADPDGFLPRASADVTAAFGGSYTATKLAIMTLDQFTADGSSNPPTNTFQLVLISDDTDTYLQFNYPPDKMGWWKDSNNNYPNVKIDYGGTALITIPGSGTSRIETNLPQGNTLDTPGRWMFKIDGTCPVCPSPAGGYTKECEGGDATKCVCSSCDAAELETEKEPENSGLTQEQKTIVIAITVVGGVALIAMAVGLGIYFGKFKDKNALKKQHS